MTEEQLLEKLDSSFLKIALGDIKRASHIEVNTTLAVFILGSCLIEALAGFRFGQTRPDQKGSGDRFRKFVKEYLGQYDEKDLWKSLRCGLVHSYAEKGKYIFVNKKPLLHFKKHKNGRLIVNDENFVKDLEAAYQQFKKSILNDGTIFLNAEKRLKSLGLMVIKETATEPGEQTP